MSRFHHPLCTFETSSFEKNFVHTLLSHRTQGGELQRVQYFGRWFLQTVAEFGIRFGTLFFKHHFCFQRTRTTTIYWHELSWNNCTAGVFLLPHISHHTCLYIAVNYFPSPPIPIGNIITVSHFLKS